MIVCHCHAVTDRDIRKAAENGARTCEEVRRACQAGGDCGGCQPHVQMILRNLQKHAESQQAAAG